MKSMGGKNPILIVAGLLLVLVALGLYQWMVMSENALLREETGQTRQLLGKLKRERDAVQNRLSEISMTLDDKKRYISDIDGKFLKANADLETKNTALQRCTEEKKKDAEKQKNDLKAKEDQQKKLEEEKKKALTDLEEFKKLCTVANMTTDVAKKLCPQQPVVQPKQPVVQPKQPVVQPKQ